MQCSKVLENGEAVMVSILTEESHSATTSGKSFDQLTTKTHTITAINTHLNFGPKVSFLATTW